MKLIMIRIAVCDDSEKDLAEVSNLLSEYILDILMPGMTGLDVVSEIRKGDDSVPVILLTNSKEYALEAYSLDVHQYLVKPVVKEHFFKKMDALFDGLHKRDEECVILHLSGGISRVPINNIICVELSDHIMTFYMRDGSALESKYLRTPFAEAAAPLMNDPRFLRPHHSFLVNMNYVDKMTKQYFYMKNGRIIKIAKQKSKEASTDYLNYLSKQWRP
ncbi:MAG: response regulator [Oscillospiraceae bacterium]